MGQNLIFKFNSKQYEKDKYSFQNDNFIINVNNVDIKKIVLLLKHLMEIKVLINKQLNIVLEILSCAHAYFSQPR